MTADKWFHIAVSEYQLQAKIPPGHKLWGQFNGSFHNVDLKDTDLMRVIDMGRPITTHHANNWRTTENYLRGQHIGLDFDSEDDHSKMSTLAKNSFIQKYAAFIHTTVSHTEDKPRARVMFLLDGPIMQAKNYGLAASALLWLFGTADRQCKDAVRFFYGARGCEFEHIGNILPLEVIKKLIGNYLESGANERKQATRPDYLPPASQQEVSEALKFIDPMRVDYSQWVSVLMAIHAQFGEAGRGLADSWARGYPGEVDRKWKSFNQSGNEIGAVTIATVFGLAKEKGWSKKFDSAAV